MGHQTEAKEDPMKKKVKKESGPSRIQEAEERIRELKTIRDLCSQIVSTFNVQGDIFSIVEAVSPWGIRNPREQEFDRVVEALVTSFGVGYALGQMLDLPDVDITPIKELLKKEGNLLYFPHERKVA